MLVPSLMQAPVAQADPATEGIAFTSQPTVAALVAHYTVTPGASSGVKASAAAATPTVPDDRQLPRLSPKHQLAAASTASTGQSNGPVSTAERSTAQTPPASASFIGQQGSKSTCSYFAQGCNPPDMALAASPDAVLQGVNTQWEVLDPSGHVQPGWPLSAQQFFGVPKATKADGTPCDVAHGSQPFLSDPRALYDPKNHRFWAAMLQAENTLGIALDCASKSVYYISVSQTSDPRGPWNVYEFEMSGGTDFGADFTQIGLNSDAVFFSANMFQNTSTGFFAEVFEANKAQMENGQGNFTAAGFRRLQGTGPGTAKTGPLPADTVQPVLDLNQARGDRRSSKSGGADGLFLDTVDGPDLLNGHLCSSPTDACQGLMMWRMSNPTAHDKGGPAPTLTGTYIPDTKPFSFPPAADQPSCNQCVDANDLRIPATPMMKNGTIYAAWGTGLDNGTQVVPAIEWAQVHPGEHAADVQTNYFALSGDTAATYPALMPDPAGNVLMLYERMGHTVPPEARFTFRTSDQDNFSALGRLLKAGEASYRPTLCGTTALPVCRWGDFEAASWDGQGRIWFAGEYTNTHTDRTTAPWFGRNWGTWIGAMDTSGGD
jgi:hypothetical protein